MNHDRKLGAPVLAEKTAQRIRQTVDCHFDALTPNDRAALAYAVDVLHDLSDRVANRHGTRTGYERRGCRCADCAAAMKVYNRERNQRAAARRRQALRVEP
jgi:hypothetical protein